ncbi:MAG: outer membrane beta-barrel protein [Bacteroidota bacterium]
MKSLFMRYALLGLLIACAAPARAYTDTIPNPDRFNMSAFMGAYRFDDFPYDPCMLFGTRLGLRLREGLEVEGEFLMGSVENRTLEDGFLANVNLRVVAYPFRSRLIKPYGFGGLGYYEFTGFEGQVPDSRFGWLAGAGASFAFSAKTRGFTELRLAYFPTHPWGQPGQFGAVWGVRRSF